MWPAVPPEGIKLREANQQQQFNRNVEDIELWLYEVEGHLASDDYGKDLTSVQNLQKKHALLEADVAAHQVHTPTRGLEEGEEPRQEQSGSLYGLESIRKGFRDPGVTSPGQAEHQRPLVERSICCLDRPEPEQLVEFSWEELVLRKQQTTKTRCVC